MKAQSVGVWWNRQKRAWCTEIDRKRYTLAKGRANKQEAQDALAEILRERALLSKVKGVISVAGLCERFLADAEENLSPATYESYQYAPPKAQRQVIRILLNLDVFSEICDTLDA